MAAIASQVVAPSGERLQGKSKYGVYAGFSRWGAIQTFTFSIPQNVVHIRR